MSLETHLSECKYCFYCTCFSARSLDRPWSPSHHTTALQIHKAAAIQVVIKLDIQVFRTDSHRSECSPVRSNNLIRVLMESDVAVRTDDSRRPQTFVCVCWRVHGLGRTQLRAQLWLRGSCWLPQSVVQFIYFFWVRGSFVENLNSISCLATNATKQIPKSELTRGVPALRTWSRWLRLQWVTDEGVVKLPQADMVPV